MSESEALLQKATESLTSAEILFEADRSTDCVSRAYYAMHQATQALLLAHGIESTSHKGVRMLFGKHFVKTEKSDRRYAASLREAYDARLVADYSGEAVTSEEAQHLLSDAQAFVAEVQRRFVEGRVGRIGKLPPYGPLVITKYRRSRLLTDSPFEM